MEYFLTVASVNSSGFESKVLSIHIRQRQYLRLVIKGNHCHHRVRSRTFPCQAESIICPCHFKHYISTSMCRLLHHKILTVFRFHHHDIRIVSFDKGYPFFRLLADNYFTRIFQLHTQKSANASRSGPDNQYSIFFLYFRYSRSPISGSQNVTYEKSLFVCNIIRNTVQSHIRMRYTHVACLSAVYAASQGPSSILVFTIIHITVFAEETLTAISFHVHGNTVAQLHIGNFPTNLFNHSYHLMTYGYSWYSTRHTAMLYMKVTSAYTAQSYTHYSVFGIDDMRNRLTKQCKMPFLKISICRHVILLIHSHIFKIVLQCRQYHFVCR